MANSLLDFVMSVVRDPGAAAAYAADPAQAIAAANLHDVTSVDVDNLIPVVSESLSSAMPSGGFATGGDTLVDSAHNVWASGAATAAFDAFDDHLPIQGADVVAAHVPAITNAIDQPLDSARTVLDSVIDAPLDVPVVEDVHAFDAGMIDAGVIDAGVIDDALDGAHHAASAATQSGQDDYHEHSQDPGFDIFT